MEPFQVQGCCSVSGTDLKGLGLGTPAEGKKTCTDSRTPRTRKAGKGLKDLKALKKNPKTF